MDTNIVAVQIELTNACSCACAECPREEHMSRKVGSMDFELAKLIISDGLKYKPSMGFNLNGLGEPLLYKRMPEILQHIEESGGTHVDFFTSLKAPNFVIDRTFDYLSKSRLDVTLAMTKHIYTVEGKKNIDWEAFEFNFKKAMTLPANVHKHLSMIATKYHSEEDLLAFDIHYSNYLPKENIHVIKNLNPWFNTVADMAHPEYGHSGSTMERNVCDYPFILLHVGWDGTCLVCCSDDVDGELELGKIEKEGDLQAIWEGEQYQELRRKHNEYVIDMAPCNKCERTAWARLS